MDENVLEYASAYADGIVNAGVLAARRASEVETHPDFDGETCIDCGDDIPEGRLALGKIRCVHCQELLEKR